MICAIASFDSKDAAVAIDRLRGVGYLTKTLLSVEHNGAISVSTDTLHPQLAAIADAPARERWDAAIRGAVSLVENNLRRKVAPDSRPFANAATSNKLLAHWSKEISQGWIALQTSGDTAHFQQLLDATKTLESACFRTPHLFPFAEIHDRTALHYPALDRVREGFEPRLITYLTVNRSQAHTGERAGIFRDKR